MKITGIRVYQHDLEIAGGRYKMAISTVESLDSTVVEILTDTDQVGYGETVPLGPTYQHQHALGARAAIEEIAPALIGLDPTKTGLIYRAMDRALLGHNYAKSAIDIACWDLAAKSYGVRVCDLLGGADRRHVPAWYGVMPASAAKTAESAVRRQDEGYDRIQVKAGGRPLDEDIQAVRAVAEVLKPTTRLLVDPNRGWTSRDTLEFSVACRDIALSIEQPCRTYDELKSIAPRLSHPIFVDESSVDVSSVITAITDGVAQGFSMKLSRIGGLTPLRTVRDICEARSIPLTIDDTWGGDIVAAALTHMGATVDPAVYEGTWISYPYTSTSYATVSPDVRTKNGRIAVPRGDGLGVEPDLTRWPKPVAEY